MTYDKENYFSEFDLGSSKLYLWVWFIWRSTFVNRIIPFSDLKERGRGYGFIHRVLTLAASSLGVFPCSRFFGCSKTYTTKQFVEESHMWFSFVEFITLPLYIYQMKNITKLWKEMCTILYSKDYCAYKPLQLFMMNSKFLMLCVCMCRPQPIIP